MRPFAVAFAHDPAGYARLVLAQDGCLFLVARAEHDTTELVGEGNAFWFGFGDMPLAPRIAQAYFGDGEGWAAVFKVEA